MAFLLLVTSSGISLIKCGKKVSSCSADKGCSSDGDHKGCCHNESFDFDLEFDSIEIIPDVNIENSLSSIYTGYSLFFSKSFAYRIYHIQFLSPFRLVQKFMY